MTPPLKPIPGLPGYSASADGRIFSHFVRRGFGPQVVDMDAPPRELRQFDRKTLKGGFSGYRSVNATRDGKRCNRFVHELVLLAWVGDRPGTPDEIEACHCNGNRADNRVENLRWDTVKANAADREMHRLEREGEESFSDWVDANV